MKQKHFIDSHKLMNAPAIVALMAYYHAFDNATAWVYLALHGTYGLLWNLKSLSFPDKQWEQRTGLGYGLFIWFGLSLYWITPWIIASRSVHAPPWLLCLAVAMACLGVCLHFASDMQKHTSLALAPGRLLTTGLWARCRNPNYLGELLIYGAFAVLGMHWAPFAVLALILAVVWIPNMVKKDRSLSRYPEFAAWKARSGLLFPRLLPARRATSVPARES